MTLKQEPDRSAQFLKRFILQAFRESQELGESQVSVNSLNRNGLLSLFPEQAEEWVTANSENYWGVKSKMTLATRLH